MKDELGGKIMTEFVALRAKMYAYRKIDKEVEEKRCKGTKKCVVSEGLTFDDYKTCLFDGKTIYRGQMLFENKKHEMYTVSKLVKEYAVYKKWIKKGILQQKFYNRL